MKQIIAVAALVAASFGAAAAPVLAQDATVVETRSDRQGQRVHRNGPLRGLNMLGLVCSDRGAEALEIAFVRLFHRLDLSDTQQPLFDDLRIAALTGQTAFADTCAEARPAAGADGNRPDLVERFRTNLAVEQARLAALTEILPAFEAFYASLSEDQRATLTPRRQMLRLDRGEDRGRWSRPLRERGPDRMERAPAPGRG